MYKTLLTELQTALNEVYSGNTLNQEVRQYDEYFCTVCRGRVSEDKYNHKHNICFGCFYGEDVSNE